MLSGHYTLANPGSDLKASQGFLVAGGAALLASDLIAGRAGARDFADVYLLAQRFGKEALLS